MQSSHRVYLRTFVGCLALSLAAIATFNILVDPLGAYPALNAKAFEPYRKHLTSRAAKAEMVAHGECEVLLLGTSRVEVGLPVENPGYGSTRVYNLALQGTSLPELSAALDFALQHNHIKRVFFGADFLLFSDVRGLKLDFENSRFNPSLNLIGYQARNVFGWQATSQSWSVLQRARHHRMPLNGEHGVVRKVIPPKLGQREVFERRIRGFLIDPDTYLGYHYSPAYLELFRDMLRRCRNHGAEVIVFIPPVHALELETVRVAGLWSIFEQWKTEITRVVAEESSTAPVPLWDFTGYRDRVAEEVPPAEDKVTRMKWYIESSHFTPALGTLVVDRLCAPNDNSAKEDQFGIRLTPENIEARQKQIRADRENYAATHPNEIAWVQDIATKAKGQIATDDDS